MGNKSDRMILGQSYESRTQLRLPSSIDPSTTFHLIVVIRDTFDLSTEFSLPSVNIHPDYVTISNFIDHFQTMDENDTIRRLLNNSDKNIVGQLITSISELFNEINEEIITVAIQSMRQVFIGISMMKYCFSCRWIRSYDHFHHTIE